MLFSFTRVSRNKKTGPIPVVTASKDSCPDTCPLRKAGCYAEYGPLALQWQKVRLSLKEVCREIRRLPKGQLWRYGQAGDLPEDPTPLIKANAGRPVICYTHRRDVEMIRKATAAGFHINISADDLEEANQFAQQGLSTVVVLRSEYGRKRSSKGWGEKLSEYKSRLQKLARTTKDGIPIAVCPATYHDVTCAQCGLCARARKNGTIVGFPAHGSGKRHIDIALQRTRSIDSSC